MLHNILINMSHSDDLMTLGVYTTSQKIKNGRLKSRIKLIHKLWFSNDMVVCIAGYFVLIIVTCN